MNFQTDQQTLVDLSLTGKVGSTSIFQLFNHTSTRGGADLLENMFLYPMTDREAINQRSGIFQFFNTLAITFPFKTEHLDSAELYLSMSDERTKLGKTESSLMGKFNQLVHADGNYQLIQHGVHSVLYLLYTMREFTSKIKGLAGATVYEQPLQIILDWLSQPALTGIPVEATPAKLAYSMLADYDQLIRFKNRGLMKTLLRFIYELDVYFCVSDVARKNEFSYPVALSGEGQIIKIKQFYHPLVRKAVGNDLTIDPSANIVFLTGANMAGKSTFMKSLSIAIYLAHMGFPVPAKHMEFSVRDGMYTTINLPDDLGAGTSHFYAEVLRLKKIAKEISAGKKLFVVFDELFRGTNVKDACEGTIAVTTAFAAKKNCMYVVSSHITEAGEALKERCSNINFVYLPSIMNGDKPSYTYQLKTGITADRHGMTIINNERILEIIRSRNAKIKR